MNPKPFLLMTTLVVLSSCSVLEERAGCPCILEITTNNPRSGRVLDVAGFDEKGLVLFDRFGTEECPYSYEREVRRCHLTVSGVLHIGEAEYSEDGRVVSVKRGLEADSLFAGVVPVDATGETASSIVLLHKQFTTVTLFEEQEREDSCPLGLEVEGGCAGLDVLTLEAVSGDFSYSADFDGEGTSFRIPRMNDGALLWISIVKRDTGELYQRFHIGQIMEDAGYDCNAEDLQDVEIGVNLVNFKCRVTVRNWNGQAIVADI